MHSNHLAVAILVLFLSLGSFIAPSYAQALDPYYARLSEMNRIKPYQNPQWDRFDRVQKNAIVDNKNKVIGSLKGVTLGQNGTVEALNVDLNRLQLGQTTLNYNAMRVRAGSASYILGFSDSAIKDNYASMLANTEPASGSGFSGISASSLKGAVIEVSDGRRIGKINEVMFSKRNDRAEAVVADISYRGVRAGNIAIPFTSLDFESVGSTHRITMDAALADVLLNYASRK